MESLTFQYPTWYILLCIAIGLSYALILYYKHSFIKDPTPGQKRLQAGLGVIRFFAVTIIALMLLSPFIKSKFTETRKPVILYLQDNSESVKNIFSEGMDSSTYAQQMNTLTESLNDQFEVESYSFSESLTPDPGFTFDGKLTNLSNNLNELISLHAGQNIGAVVLATDGIYNKGANPLYNVAKTKFPIYTVALGDTTPQKDLKIDKVLSNRIVYLNDRFKIQVNAVSDNIPSAKSQLDVYYYASDGRKKLESREIEFTPDTSYISEDFVLDATQTGIQRYRISLNPVEQEFTTANNYKDIFIDVLDSRQRVLIVANAPHPDVAALKQAIESNKNYEVTVASVDKLAPVNFEEYNLAILHQIPSKRYPSNDLIESLDEVGLPMFFIIGHQSALSTLDDVQGALNIGQSQPNFNQATAVVNEDFALFTTSDELQRNLPEYPPLSAPFGDYNTSPSAKTFLLQKIGAVGTDYPLLLFDEALNTKVAVLTGEGIWRWRLYDYLENQSHELFNELVTKTVQYLAVKQDKRQFRVVPPKNVFYENESITFQAELYNDSYELINFPDVSITLIDEKGKEYPYIFNKTNNAYTLDAGNFPVGNYSFRAEVKYGGETLNHSGKFTIVPMQLEAFNTVANHQLLYQLSEKTGGEMFYPAQTEALSERLLNNNELKPVVYNTYKTESIINLKWILAIIMGLLAVEWFTRKYEGAY